MADLDDRRDDLTDAVALLCFMLGKEGKIYDEHLFKWVEYGEDLKDDATLT